MSPLLQKCVLKLQFVVLLTSPLTRTVCKMCGSQINLQNLHVKSEAVDQMLSAGVWVALWRGERMKWIIRKDNSVVLYS